MIWGYPEGLTSDRTRKNSRHLYIQTLFQVNCRKQLCTSLHFLLQSSSYLETFSFSVIVSLFSLSPLSVLYFNPHNYIHYYQARKAGMVYLYDLLKDPNETNNLAGKKKKLSRYLQQKIKTLLRSGTVVPPDTPPPKFRSLPKFHGGVVSPGWCQAN